VVLFAMGNIALRDSCKIQQKQKPLRFTAKDYLEMLPGFESDVTNTGAIVAQPLVIRVTEISSAKKAPKKGAVKTKKELEPQKVADSRFALFPNPTTGAVNITIDSGDAIQNTLLFDVSGKLISEYPKSLTFSIDRIPSGTYIYRIETEKNSYSGKIIKQ